MSIMQLAKPENQIQRNAMSLLVVIGLLLITLFRYLGSENDLVEKIANESKIVTSNIAASLLFRDEEEIEKIHSSLKYSNDILLSCLYDKEGHLISSIGEANISLSLFCGSGHKQNPLLYTEITPITYKNNLIGRLEVHVSRLHVLLDTIVFLVGTSAIALMIWFINVFAIKKLSIKLESYESQLQQLMARRDNIIENEHRKIAIEIHDQIGQLLSSANFNIRYLKNGLDSKQSMQLLEDTENILSQVYSRVKNISSELHPAILDFGIQAAIEWLADTRLTANNIEWNIKRNRKLKTLPPDISIVLFKISQEAFTNILRHSHATLVSIQLHSNNKVVKMMIKDNGIGMRKDSVKKGISLGLIGISERAKSIGGNVEISSNHTGTTLQVTLPIQESKHVRTNQNHRRR